MHVKQPHNTLKQILNVIPKNCFYRGVNNFETAYDWDSGILSPNFLGFRIEKFCGLFGIFSDF